MASLAARYLDSCSTHTETSIEASFFFFMRGMRWIALLSMNWFALPVQCTDDLPDKPLTFDFDFYFI